MVEIHWSPFLRDGWKTLAKWIWRINFWGSKKLKIDKNEVIFSRRPLTKHLFLSSAGQLIRNEEENKQIVPILHTIEQIEQLHFYHQNQTYSLQITNIYMHNAHTCRFPSGSFEFSDGILFYFYFYFFCKSLLFILIIFFLNINV
jgi:hypothetical protein